MVPFLDLKAVNARYGADIVAALGRVARSGWYLQGQAVQQFEADYARYIGTQHCVGVGNGLDALTLIYRAYIEMGIMKAGDEVIVPANTYIASILAISENRLKPVLVEPRSETLQIDDTLIEQAITPRTRSIMIVHLYGRCAYTPTVKQLCDKYRLLLVEDNAQAHGCCYGGARTGALGHAAGHSFYPTKNLGALGDAGAVTTDDAALAGTVRALANYGSARKYVFDYKGRNSRLDELQAAVLSVKLQHLDDDNRRRQAIAQTYYDGISNAAVVLPMRMADESNVYHLFPVLCDSRQQLQQHLLRHGIETQVHYPTAPHRQHCYSEWSALQLPITERIHRTEVSLPLNTAMTDDDAAAVVDAVNAFTTL